MTTHPFAGARSDWRRIVFGGERRRLIIAAHD